MSLELIIHNAGFLLGAIINIFLVGFVLRNKWGKLDSTAITFILMSLAVSTYEISHVLGIMAPDPDTSRKILMFNLSVAFSMIFLCHWFLALSKRVKEYRIGLTVVYVTGFLVIIFFSIFPHQFLLDSVTGRMYFPLYYNPAPLQIYMRLWVVFVGVYLFYIFIKIYIDTKDPVERNRYKYVISSTMFAVFVGSTATFLIYGINFDPILSMLFGFYPIPLAYAMIRYELLDIRLLAKRAFLYASIIAFVAVIVGVMGIIMDSIAQTYPDFPTWIGHATTSLVIGIMAIIVWNRLKEADVLKYEFVNIITHKFRTPLTRIKWSIETLGTKSQIDEEAKEGISAIRMSNSQLVELTNALAALNDSEAASHVYRSKHFSIAEFLQKFLVDYQSAYKEKNVQLNYEATTESTMINADPGKINFVFQILLDNALIYTPTGGTVTVSVQRKGKAVVIEVKDNGIGISKTSLPYIFNKFYRADNARVTDTEGNGIGLFMVQELLARNNGKIAVNSEGEGKGTVFTIVFPVVS